MSTTVSYKGQTLTTVSNDTKTLLTEGKYLEDDLTLTDVSGGGSTLITKSISANGTYNASSDSADGYSQVTVAVPNTYTAGDEGKVVSSGALVSQTSKNINSNGTHSTVTNNQVVVAVPNSYSAGDEGKVVSNGELVAQTAHADVTPTTSDQTIDTTLNNSLKVKGDADLVAGNIKKDVEIFGVTGSYEGGGGGLSLVDVLQGDAPAGDISFVATKIIPANAIAGRTLLTGLDIDLSNGKYGLARNAIASNDALTQVVLRCTTTQNQAPRFESYSITSCNSCVRIIERGYSGGHDNNAFRGNSALKVFDMQNFYNAYWLNAISENMFYGASGFDTLILRMDSIPSCRGTTAFSNTKFASGQTGGTIYIPEALYNHLGDGTSLDYKNATGWSAVDSGCVVTWAKIEGSPYESLTWYEA